MKKNQITGNEVNPNNSEVEALKAQIAELQAAVAAKKTVNPKTTLRFAAIAAARAKLAAGESKEAVTEFITTSEEFAPIFCKTKSVRVMREVPVTDEKRSRIINGIFNMVRPAAKK